MNSFPKLSLHLSHSIRPLFTANSLVFPVIISKGAFRFSKKFSMETKPSMAVDSKPHELVEMLSALGLNDPLHKYPNCYPEANPIDIYRAHLTSILTELTGVDASIVYPALQWTQTLEKGDLVVPVPALRIKGKKPAELAEEWAEKVSSCFLRCIIC